MTFHPITFIYDADCGMCTSAVRLLSRLDWRNRVSWVSAQSLDAPPRGLSWENLERSAYLKTPAGDLHEGFFAVRALLLRLPLTLPVGALMMLPGVRLAGVPAYRWVARNRHRLSRGCLGTGSRPRASSPVSRRAMCGAARPSSSRNSPPNTRMLGRSAGVSPAPADTAIPSLGGGSGNSDGG